MKTIDRAFPYPVVAPFRDDVSKNTFEAKLDVLADGGRIYMECNFVLENASLIQLIEEGSATFAMHLEAERVYYRRLFSNLSSAERLDVRGTDLQGTVEWLPMVISSAQISDYKPDGMHADYGDVGFNVEKNEILAIGRGGKFIVEPHYDPLRRLSSIMQVQKSEKTQSGPYEVDFSGEKITVFLSAEDHQNYGQLRALTEVEGILCNAVVLPALAEAVRLLKTEETGARWNVVLRKRLDEMKHDWRETGEPLDLAQRVLASPLRRGLADLMALTGGDDE